MDKSPKRRKSKDNPYTIYIIDNKYIVEFIDGTGVIQRLNVSKEIYDSFNEFELKDKSQMNEYDNHIERNEVYEETLYKRANLLTNNLEDELIKKAEFEVLRNAINKLPEIQKRRIKMYYFDELTQQQIADVEKANIRNIQASLNIALKNIRNNLKK